MKKRLLLGLLAAIGLTACGQTIKTKTKNATTTPVVNSLLWRISGNGLTKPSYLFGTMHVICASDIVVSDSLKQAIQGADNVYLEIQMDDMLGMMFSTIAHINMKGDTTLSDLLTPDELTRVKNYFQKSGNGMFSFQMMQRFKPFFLASMLTEQSAGCATPVSVESLIMDEARDADKDIKGLETVEYQLAIFDQIPYKDQAQMLVKMLDEPKSKSDDAEMSALTNAYRNQELSTLEKMTAKDESIGNYADILLYNRNANWAAKLPALMAQKSLVIAVGAGHLPGDKGVINLLRKAGYTVEPVKNEMIVPAAGKKSKSI